MSQASCGVMREDLGLLSRPCRKRRASSRDDGGISWFFFFFSFFLKLQRDVWGFSQVTMGNAGSLCVAPGKFSLYSSCEGEHGTALESWQGNRALRCIEGGISRSFWSCSRKPWLPSTCDSDLRELLRELKGSQEYCGVGGASWDSTGVSAKKEGLISS